MLSRSLVLAVALFGGVVATGGAGSTSVAVNLACILAGDEKNSVALIDLDLSLGDAEGGVKIVANRKQGKILGVHIVGHRATELIAEAAMAIQLEALAEDLAWAIRVHPTLSESLVEAGRGVVGQALYLPRF